MAAERSPPDALRVPNDNDSAWLCRRLWERVNEKNLHFMGAFVGEEGSGKSHTAIRVASEVDPGFTADRVIFDVADLLRALRDGEHSVGDFYVLDEAGVQFGRRTWAQRSQVLANQALQIIRDENLGLIFTIPALGDFDSQAQRRLQAFYELTDKKEGEHVRGKWKFMDPDRTDDTGTIYKKYPRRRVDGHTLRITSLAFKPPDPDIIAEYTKRKEAFQEEFYDEAIAALDDSVDTGEEEDDSLSAQDIADEIQATDSVDAFESVHAGNGTTYIDWMLIRAEYDTSRRDSKTVKKLLERDLSDGDAE